MTDDELRLQTAVVFRLRAAERVARLNRPTKDLVPATVAAFQVQLEEDVARGDPVAVELQESLLTSAITHLVENPRWF